MPPSPNTEGLEDKADEIHSGRTTERWEMERKDEIIGGGSM